MPSIIEKLNRLGGIELSRMQDIGGFRIVVPTIDDIKKSMTDYLKKFYFVFVKRKRLHKHRWTKD